MHDPRPAETFPKRLRFQDLQRRRVRRILLVSSLYDSFILAEDGQLYETVLSQFVELNLYSTPDIMRVPSGGEALAVAQSEGPFDLIITSLHVGDMDAVELATRLRAAGLDIPVVLLAYDNRELTDFRARHGLEGIERTFLWQGDVRVLLAIVKYIEDRWNVRYDTGVAGVPAIILVEDNVRFYSAFLPEIYTELVKHTRGLIAEGLNFYQKTIRMRARPKILLCETFEEAWDAFSTYGEHVLGVISDIEFPKDGRLERHAGIELARRMRAVRLDLPIMLQSSFPKNAALAQQAGTAFGLKQSPVLIRELRRFMVNSFGFGDFTFHADDGRIIDRASDLKSLVQKLRSVAPESIAYHAARNHFSNWLKARGEYALANLLRPRRVEDYPSVEDLRADLVQSIETYRKDRDLVIVADFHRHDYDPTTRMARIGSGSLGGKARGLAFVNRLLADAHISDEFRGVRIFVPQSVVLGTGVFDQFMDQNDLSQFALNATSEEDTLQRFLAATFPEEPLRDLEAMLRQVRYPLAVRSSGLLEDAPNQPFAGLYQTYMVPNNHSDAGVRLQQLVGAIKRVYASTFSTRAKRFLKTTPYRLEEERMAVIIQRVVGAAHGRRFYPEFAGVARSHNHYAVAPLVPEDGIVAVAVGLGSMVVEGEPCVRFCPTHPQLATAFGSTDGVVRDSQREFLALDLSADPQTDPPIRWTSRHALPVAEDDGTLHAAASTWSSENDALADGMSRAGVRVVTFAPVLKHDLFPLAGILRRLLQVSAAGTSSPVELEFAVNLSVARGEPAEFGFLQMRPLARLSEGAEIEIGEVEPERLLCRSNAVLGYGHIGDIRDLVVVDPSMFERRHSHAVAQQLSRLNATLQQAGIPYVLIGVGRWGSADPLLGIPVAWSQIAGARVIVEAGFRDFVVEPSQGTHFFQNLSSCNVGYFTVNSQIGQGCIDWDWLAAQPRVQSSGVVHHLRLAGPIVVKMSGRGQGVILKPADAAVGR